MNPDIIRRILDPHPLYLPERDGTYVPPLGTALGSARETLAKRQPTDIHDHSQLVEAAAALEGALRQLVGALDAAEAKCSTLPDAWRTRSAVAS